MAEGTQKSGVFLNENALLTPAVHLDYYYDENRSTRLSEGYIFSYKEAGFGTGQISGVDVLMKVKDAFARDETTRILSIIATYGIGKSHLALALANFFGRGAEHRAVQGILRTLENLGPALSEEFGGSKKRWGKPHLVLPITLSDTADLRQRVRLSIKTALANAGVDGYCLPGGHEAARDWLAQLSQDARDRAETWLENRWGISIDELRDQVEALDSESVSVARELSQTLYNTPLDFGHDLSLADTLQDLVDSYCGAKGPFAGVLILLDELSAYLEHWIRDRNRAGGMALQELTDIVARVPRRLALVTLSQFPLSEYERRGRDTEGATIAKLTGRLEPSFRLVSSLEHVVDRIVVQQPDLVEILDANASVRSASDAVYELQPSYRERFDAYDFWEIVGRGCFPMHPFTVTLLCYLADHSGFVQGRALIHFLNAVLKPHLARPVFRADGTPNYLLPNSIIDFFEDRLIAQEGRYLTLYRDYEWALLQIGGRTAPSTEIAVLKAILLGELCQIPRPEHHDQLIGLLAGLPTKEVRECCDELVERGVIRFDRALNPPGFTLWHGAGGKLDELIRENAKKSLEKKQVQPVMFLQNDVILGKLWNRCQDFFNGLDARRFKTITRCSAESWRLDVAFVTSDSLSAAGLRVLRKRLPAPEEAQGLLVVVIAEDPEELPEIETRALNVLDPNDSTVGVVARRTVVAIPRRPMIGLRQAAANLMGLMMVTEKDKQRYGTEAFEACEERYQEDFLQIVGIALQELTYVVHSDAYQDLPPAARSDLQATSCHLFLRVFPYAPKVNGDDKMASHKKGTKPIAHLARFLLRDRLSDGLLGKNKSYQSVVDNALREGGDTMGLVGQGLRINSTPASEAVYRAWQKISDAVQPGTKTTISRLWSELAAPPFGYDPNSFIFLLSAWIGWHRDEIAATTESRGTCTVDQLSEMFAEYKTAKPLFAWLCKSVRLSRTERQQVLGRFHKLRERLSEPASYRELLDSIRELEALQQRESALTDEDQKEIAKSLRQAHSWGETVRNFQDRVRSVESSVTDHGALDLVKAVSNLDAFAHQAEEAGLPAKLAQSLEDQISEARRRITRLLATRADALAEGPSASIEECESTLSELNALFAATEGRPGLRDLTVGVKKRIAALEERHEQLCRNAENNLLMERLRAEAQVDSSASIVYLDRQIEAIHELSGQFCKPTQKLQDEIQQCLQALVEERDRLVAWLADLKDRLPGAEHDLAEARRLKDELLQTRLRFSKSEHYEEELTTHLHFLNDAIARLEGLESHRLQEARRKEREGVLNGHLSRLRDSTTVEQSIQSYALVEDALKQLASTALPERALAVYRRQASEALERHLASWRTQASLGPKTLIECQRSLARCIQLKHLVAELDCNIDDLATEVDRQEARLIEQIELLERDESVRTLINALDHEIASLASSTEPGFVISHFLKVQELNERLAKLSATQDLVEKFTERAGSEVAGKLRLALAQFDEDLGSLEKVRVATRLIENWAEGLRRIDCAFDIDRNSVTKAVETLREKERILVEREHLQGRIDRTRHHVDNLLEELSTRPRDDMFRMYERLKSAIDELQELDGNYESEAYVQEANAALTRGLSKSFDGLPRSRTLEGCLARSEMLRNWCKELEGLGEGFEDLTQRLGQALEASLAEERHYRAQVELREALRSLGERVKASKTWRELLDTRERLEQLVVPDDSDLHSRRSELLAALAKRELELLAELEDLELRLREFDEADRIEKILHDVERVSHLLAGHERAADLDGIRSKTRLVENTLKQLERLKTSDKISTTLAEIRQGISDASETARNLRANDLVGLAGVFDRLSRQLADRTQQLESRQRERLEAWLKELRTAVSTHDLRSSELSRLKSQFQQLPPDVEDDMVSEEAREEHQCLLKEIQQAIVDDTISHIIDLFQSLSEEQRKECFARLRQTGAAV